MDLRGGRSLPGCSAPGLADRDAGSRARAGGRGGPKGAGDFGGAGALAASQGGPQPRQHGGPLDDQRAAAPDRRHAGLAGTVPIRGRVATNVATELACRALGAAGAAGQERGSGRQIAGGLGRPARQGRQELSIRARRVRHRGGRGIQGRCCHWQRLGRGLHERDERKEGEKEENGLFHGLISQVDGTGRKPAKLNPPRWRPAWTNPGSAGDIPSPRSGCVPETGSRGLPPSRSR